MLMGTNPLISGVFVFNVFISRISPTLHRLNIGTIVPLPRDVKLCMQRTKRLCRTSSLAGNGPRKKVAYILNRAFYIKNKS